jgi:hypothetical protein
MLQIRRLNDAGHRLCRSPVEATERDPVDMPAGGRTHTQAYGDGHIQKRSEETPPSTLSSPIVPRGASQPLFLRSTVGTDGNTDSKPVGSTTLAFRCRTALEWAYSAWEARCGRSRLHVDVCTCGSMALPALWLRPLGASGYAVVWIWPHADGPSATYGEGRITTQPNDWRNRDPHCRRRLFPATSRLYSCVLSSPVLAAVSIRA